MHSLKIQSALAFIAMIAVNSTMAHESDSNRFMPFSKPASSQEQLPPNDPLLLGDPTLQPQSIQPEKKSNWMVESPLGKVGWPEVKMPKVEFKPPWKSQPGQPNWFSRQANKARHSARGAAVKTRDAWNGSLDKMKLVLPGQRPADANKKPGFWHRLMNPGDPEPAIQQVPMIAQQPDETPRR